MVKFPLGKIRSSLALHMTPPLLWVFLFQNIRIFESFESNIDLERLNTLFVPNYRKRCTSYCGVHGTLHLRWITVNHSELCLTSQIYKGKSVRSSRSNDEAKRSLSGNVGDWKQVSEYVWDWNKQLDGLYVRVFGAHSSSFLLSFPLVLSLWLCVASREVLSTLPSFQLSSPILAFYRIFSFFSYTVKISFSFTIMIH